MGWASGSELFDVVIKTIKKEVPDKEARKRIYLPIFDEFCNQDWDTDNECVGLDEAYDEVRKEYYIKKGWTWEDDE